jgi:SAM-dependent methyltransferase
MDQASILLREINEELPKGVDWKAGAKRYLADIFTQEGDSGLFSRTKPLNLVSHGVALEEAIQYLCNFTNTMKLLNLPAHSLVMDVACGPGWLCHFLSRLGYQTFGFDIADDFVKLAKRRLSEDPYLGFDSAKLDSMFMSHDIEESPLPNEHLGKYDAIILESCLHHFFNPISALKNISVCLKQDGVLLLIEGENRTGSVNPRWMQVMEDTDTIERPYRRDQLLRMLQLTDLRHVHFLGQINGYYSPKDPIWGDATARLNESERFMNIAICAKSFEPMKRILPFLNE